MKPHEIKNGEIHVWNSGIPSRLWCFTARKPGQFLYSTWWKTELAAREAADEWLKAPSSSRSSGAGSPGSDQHGARS